MSHLNIIEITENLTKCLHSLDNLGFFAAAASVDTAIWQVKRAEKTRSNLDLLSACAGLDFSMADAMLTEQFHVAGTVSGGV